MSQTAKESTPETFHPEYLRNLTAWTMIEHVCEGGKTIKEKGDIYLPRLDDQTDEEWKAYLLRAVFFGATGRTREALAGMMMRRQPKFTFPGGGESDPENQSLMADVTLKGEAVTDWINMVLDCSVSTGRSGTLIDWNEDEGRPYMAHYKASDVINWAVEHRDGRETLCFLVVRETTQNLADFVVEEQKLLRRYWIGDDGAVWWDSWIENGESRGGFEEKTPAAQLVRRGKPLTAIPFVFHNAAHMGTEVGTMPLHDIGTLNISHYQMTADMKNALHVCGQPTPWATGVTSDESDDLYLGATKAWTAQDPNAKFGFLEYTGAGLEPLSKEIENTERQMAVLGARLLFDTPGGDAEAFETVQLRASSETAALVKIAAHQTATLTAALQWFYWWEGTEEKPADTAATIILNHDFSTAQMDPARLQALTSALQQNAISHEVFFWNLQKGELIPEGHDFEAERTAIQQRPVMTPAVPDPNRPNPDDEGGGE